MLLFFCDGRQIGYRHLGDYDYLDYSMAEPAFPGRFFYTTTPAAPWLTRGKTNLTLESQLRPDWAYAQTFDPLPGCHAEPTSAVSIKFTRTPTIVFSPPEVNDKAKRQKNAPATKAPGPKVIDELERA